MARPSESTPSRLKGQPGPPLDPGVRRGGSSGPQPRPTRGGAPEAGWDPKLCFPQEGSRVGIWAGGGGEGATNTVGAARGAAGRRRAGRQSAPESGSRGEPGRARGSRGAGEGQARRGGGRKSLAPPGGAGPGARSEPAAETRAYLLSEGPGRGREAAGGAHAGGSAVPSPFDCWLRQPRRRFRGVGSGAGAGGARRGSSGCYG